MNACTGFQETSSLSRRQLLNNFGMGLGGIALADMLGRDKALGSELDQKAGPSGILGTGHYEPKAKRVIYLFMAGGPSQMDLFDYKPELNKRHGEELPDSVRQGQRLTGMSGNQSSLPMVGSPFKFS